VFLERFHPGRYRQIGGIHFYTWEARADGFGAKNKSSAIAQVHTDERISMTGYQSTVSGALPRARADRSQ
jgi:hypothetical protein